MITADEERVLDEDLTEIEDELCGRMTGPLSVLVYFHPFYGAMHTAWCLSLILTRRNSTKRFVKVANINSEQRRLSF